MCRNLVAGRIPQKPVEADEMNEKDAVNVQRQCAESEGWPWENLSGRTVSGDVFRGKRWRVTSNCRKRGMFVGVVLRVVRGSVLEKGFFPRCS
jgi:hypothetical protein